MAYQCFRLALAANNDHAEAYCNLGVLEMRKGNTEQAKSLIQSAMTLGFYTFEPFYNYALLSFEVKIDFSQNYTGTLHCYTHRFQLGDHQSSYSACMKSLELFPEHADSQELMKKLNNLLTII